MGRDQGGRTPRQGLDLALGEPEPHVMDRRGDLLAGQRLGMGLFGPARHHLPRGELDPDGPFDPDQAREPVAELGLAGQLDEQGRRELALARQEPVVDLQLVADPLVGGDPFGPGHLLDLEPHRLGVLEDQRDDRTEPDPPAPLELDHPAPIVVADPLVGAQVDDVLEPERRTHRVQGAGLTKPTRAPW